MSDDVRPVEPLVFDWHKLSGTDDYESFLHWMTVNLVTYERESTDTDRTAERDLVQRVSDASDGFKNVELTIQLNGIEVNAAYFVRRIERNMTWMAEREAKRVLTENAEATELRSISNILQRALRRRAEQVAGSLGLELDEEDYL